MTSRITWSRAVLGPWPLVPLPVFAVGVLAFLNRAVLVAGVSQSGTVGYLETLITLGLLGVLITGLAMIPIALISGWRDALRLSVRNRRVPSRTAYLAACASAATVVAIAQVLSRYLALDQVTGRGIFESVPIAFVTSFGITFLVALLLMNGVGIVSVLLQRQTILLERQVVRLERQQRLIVEADQRVREEVAEALHDDVQGALLRATLRLSRVAEAAGEPEEARAVREVIADLEALRGAGVRAISRRLAPALGPLGLAGALDELGASYAGSLDVRVDVEPGSEQQLAALTHDTQLAVYRIAEQALLNTSGHPPVTTASLTLACTGGACRLEVADDGPGLDPERTPGHGSAVIDAWLGIVGGTWSLEPAPGGGARLTAVVGGD